MEVDNGGSLDGKTPVGSSADAGSERVVEPQGAAQSPENVAPQAPETPGVQPYTQDEIGNLDPTAIDFKRVTPENFQAVYHRQASVNGKISQKQREDVSRLDQMVKELKETISGNQATVMQKLLDHFESRSKAEQQASLAEEAEKERAYYESIPDEYKPMYDRLKRLEAAEQKRKEAPLDLPDDVKELVEFAKQTKAKEQQAAYYQKLNSAIDEVISEAPIDKVLKESAEFGGMVKSFINTLWRTQERDGVPFTPIPEATARGVAYAFGLAKKFSAMLGVSPAAAAEKIAEAGNGGGAAGGGNQGNGKTMTPEQIAAASAPPRLQGNQGTSTTPQEDEMGFYTNMFHQFGGRGPAR